MAARKPRMKIGIIIPNIASQSRDNFIDLICKKFYEKGYIAELCISQGDINIERKCLQSFASTTDCVLLMTVAKKYSEIADVVPKRIPVIFLFNEPEDCPHTCIVESDYSAIYQGIVSCATRNASKVAFVSAGTHSAFEAECFKAYKDALNTIAPDSFDENLIITVDDPNHFNPIELLEDLTQKGCEAIFSTSSNLTGSIVDTMMYCSANTDVEPMILLGYTQVESLLSSHLYVDLIVHPSDEIIDLAVQQALYRIHHPQSDNKRVFLLKGTLRMHHLNMK